MPVQEDFPPIPTFSSTTFALIEDATEMKNFSLNIIDGSVDYVIEKVTVGYEGLLEGVNSKNRILLL